MSGPAWNPTDSPERFRRAIARFDEENARDPNLDHVDGSLRPRELVYAERLSRWVERLAPDASEPLRLAARCQHLCRWMIPRDSYPRTRAGYLAWRSELKRFHAERAAAILREIGYDPATIERVAALNLKRDLPEDPECQVLEDALCLVFLEFQLGELAGRTDHGKLVNALTRSWAKMSPRGRAAAGSLALGTVERELVKRATGAGG